MRARPALGIWRSARHMPPAVFDITSMGSAVLGRVCALLMGWPQGWVTGRPAAGRLDARERA
jgi:hypothetical protein